MEDVTRNSIYKLDYNASLVASQQLAAAAAAAALSAAGGVGGGPIQPNIAPPSSSSSSSSPSLGVAAVSSTVGIVSPAALSASVSMSRMSLVDVTGTAEIPHSPSPVHHSATSSLATATTLPLATPSQQSLVDAAATSVSTIINQTDSSSSSTISK